jgi:two-component system heavy metal sensor histidine kinase CusS
VSTSLRMRLLVGTIGTLVSLLIIFSLIIYTTIRSALWTQFDAGLLSTAHVLAGATEQEADEAELSLSTQPLPELQDARHTTRCQLWKEDETMVAKSPVLQSEDLPRLAGPLNTPVFAHWRGRDGRPQRAVGLRFIPRLLDSAGGTPPPPPKPPQALTLTVVRDAGELYGQLRFLRGLLWTASGAVTLLSFLIAAVVVRHGLAPLNALAAQIAAIQPNDLAVRVGAARTPREIVPIRERLNDLLSRLQASFQRERRLTADIAHELRTPLAGIRTAVEVTLARGRAGDEYRAVLSDCLEIVQKMQAMINNLLLLARLDTQQMALRHEHIPLADLVNSSWRPFSERAAARRITFACGIPDDLTLVSDPDNLSIILSNLLDNATEYTNDGGRIWVTAHRADGGMELTISNTGCSLTGAQVSQVFDSFWRGDSARKDIGLHCGLGLALVQRLVKGLGGSVRAQLCADGVFALRMDIRSHSPGSA